VAVAPSPLAGRSKVLLDRPVKAAKSTTTMARSDVDIHLRNERYDSGEPSELFFEEEMEIERHDHRPAPRLIAELQEAAQDLKILLSREEESYARPSDYIAKASVSSVNAKERVSESWRRKLCEWCFEVVDHFTYDRQVVSFALNYLDRAAALKSELMDDPIPKRDYQRLAVTSLYMAIKLHGETDETEGPRRKLGIRVFVELSRGFFNRVVIEETERSILNSLNWRINPPTCLCFLASLFPLCPKWDAPEGMISSKHMSHSTVIAALYDVARYLTELSECVSYFAFQCKASMIAYGAVLCGIEALRSSAPLPAKVRHAFLRNMEESTGYALGAKATREVCAKLKGICPSMFEADQEIDALSDESFHGKVSPVSVLAAPAYHTRSRAVVDEESSHAHHARPCRDTHDDDSSDASSRSRRKRKHRPNV
jgi:lipoyl(octanoyl) transferase